MYWILKSIKKTTQRLDTLVVKDGATTLTKNEDYITSFTDDGKVLVSLIEGSSHAGASTLTVKSTSIDPSAVKAKDIIGGYDAATDKESGLELIRQVYPRFNMTPGLLLAPGWSQIPEVGIVLGSKCSEINGVFSCECVLDLDGSSTGAKKYSAVGEWKNKNGYTNKHSVVLWPQVKVGKKQYAFSAIFAALTAYTDASNDDVPNLSPSNKMAKITGLVLDDGTEVTLDQNQANLLNSQGIITAINVNGWRTWGNNTAAYPQITDILNGKIKFRQYLAPYTPAEDILNVLEFDPSMLAAAISGGGN